MKKINIDGSILYEHVPGLVDNSVLIRILDNPREGERVEPQLGTYAQKLRKNNRVVDTERAGVIEKIVSPKITDPALTTKEVKLLNDDGFLRFANSSKMAPQSLSQHIAAKGFGKIKFNDYIQNCLNLYEAARQTEAENPWGWFTQRTKAQKVCAVKALKSLLTGTRTEIVQNGTDFFEDQANATCTAKQLRACLSSGRLGGILLEAMENYYLDDSDNKQKPENTIDALYQHICSNNQNRANNVYDR